MRSVTSAAARRDRRAGHYERKLQTKAGECTEGTCQTCTAARS